VLESINGHTRDRNLASVIDTDEPDRKPRSVELLKSPDNRVGDTEPVGSYPDVEDIRLNETLKLLMETKTPMLPRRLRTVAMPQQSLAQNTATHLVVRCSAPTSTCDSVSVALSQQPRHCHAKQSIDRVSQSGADVDSKAFMATTEYLNGSCRDFYNKSPVRSSQGMSVGLSVRESHVVADMWNGHSLLGINSSPRDVQPLPAEQSSDLQHSAVAGTVPAASQSEVLKYSAPVRDTLTSVPPTVPDVDSLITQYRNLHVHQQSAVNVDQVDTVADIEDDLCNDNFDDIRLNLQNISMDSTHTSSQQKGLGSN